MPAYDLILANIGKHIQLDPPEIDFFTSLLQYRQVAKKEIIVQEGSICRYEHFVISGCFKSFSTDNKGNEHILLFAAEDWWCGDLYSFLTGKPARFTTAAIEDAEIFMIHKEDQLKLYEKVPKFERFYRLLFQNALVAQFNRIDQNLSLSAEEKYLQFRQQYPHLEQRIPQKEIASYLGITPEFLSKLRRKMAGR